MNENLSQERKATLTCRLMLMSTFWMSREEVRELDRRAGGEFGVPGLVLMENAGRGCAELLMRLNPERKPVIILCGPGNNGGDGYVMARHLDNGSWPVSVVAVEAPSKSDPSAADRFQGLPADARANYEIVVRSRLNLISINPPDLDAGTKESLKEVLRSSDGWIVDALFGTGLSRALTAPYDDLVSLVNASGKPVLAVDIPSGLDCDTGEPLGPTIRAAHTATFAALKRGFLNRESRSWTGEVHVVDIGAPRRLVDDYRTRRNMAP